MDYEELYNKLKEKINKDYEGACNEVKKMTDNHDFGKAFLALIMLRTEMESLIRFTEKMEGVEDDE